MSQSSEDLLNAEAGVIGPARTSQVFKKLRINPIKALYKYYTPHNINLAGGIPLDTCFPFKSVTVNLDGDEDDSYTLARGDDLHLNYHMSDGLVQLKHWTKAHATSIHNPPFPHEVSLTIGATDSWFKVLQLLNSECVLFDQYVYGSSATPCSTLGKRAIGVPSDAEGIIPSALRETVLLARERGLVVDILYLIPVGHNPMGVTIPLQRKQELYALCQELDLIIVEDGKQSYAYVHVIPYVHVNAVRHVNRCLLLPVLSRRRATWHTKPTKVPWSISTCLGQLALVECTYQYHLYPLHDTTGLFCPWTQMGVLFASTRSPRSSRPACGWATLLPRPTSSPSTYCCRRRPRSSRPVSRSR
jgi:hypothetical protein